MGVDTSVFSGPFGSLRLFTLCYDDGPVYLSKAEFTILGAIVVGLSANAHGKNIDDEKFFFWSAVVCLIVSAVLAIAAFLGITGSAVFVKKTDSGYHVIAGLVLIVAGVLFMISVVHYGDTGSTGFYVQRIAAAIIGLLNALIYCSLGWSICRSSS